MPRSKKYGRRTKIASTELLDEGDTVSLALTVQFQTGGLQAWLKASAETTIDGETPQQASDRVLDYLELEIARQYEDIELG